MESIFTKLALYGSKNEYARTDNVFSPISEVCDGTVSLTTFLKTETGPLADTYSYVDWQSLPWPPISPTFSSPV